MDKNFLGKGWKFPIQITEEGNIAVSSYEEDVKEAILIILNTTKGERIMRPDFGCGIHDFVFANVNTATLTLMENSIREALITWEPRIEIISIKIDTKEISNGKLLINIDYRLRNTNNRFNLVYPFYLKEK